LAVNLETAYENNGLSLPQRLLKLRAMTALLADFRGRRSGEISNRADRTAGPMSDNSIVVGALSTAQSAPQDVLARLTPLGWRGGLIAIALGMMASFFAFGYFAIYWRNADMDFMVVYNALLLNDGRPQEFFDHPAYLTILSVKYAFQGLHAIGLLDAYSLRSIPPAGDVAAFDAAMTHAVRAGRLVALATAIIVVLAFAALIRPLLRDWRVALLATCAFAFSGGVAVHMRILRSEMVAGSMVTLALLVLIGQCLRGSLWRPFALGAVALLSVLALENKVHVIPLLIAFPLLALAFGEIEARSVPFWRSSRLAWVIATATGVLAALLIWLVAPILAAGFDPANLAASHLQAPLLGRFGSYQIGLLAYTALVAVIFAITRKVSAAETATALFALAGGAALGLLALDIVFNPANAVAVLNPVEKMQNFSALPDASSGNLSAVIELFAGIFIAVLERYSYSFVFYTSARPTVFVLWLVLAGIVYALWIRKWQLALQAALLVGVAACIDTLGVPRGLKSEYFILSDPFIIIAAALLLDQLEQVTRMRWALTTGIALVVAHVVVAHPEPIKMVTKKSGPEFVCYWNQLYEPLLPMPWCAQPAIKPLGTN